MPNNKSDAKKTLWSQIPDPGFPENNSHQTKNLRWTALGLAIHNMKIPCLDHQCRNQLRPCQSEVHGTWAKANNTTSCRKVLGSLWFPGPWHTGSLHLQSLLKSSGYKRKSQSLKSQEPVAALSAEVKGKILNSSKIHKFYNIHLWIISNISIAAMFSQQGGSNPIGMGSNFGETWENLWKNSWGNDEF